MAGLDLARRAQYERIVIARNYRQAMLEKDAAARAARLVDVERSVATFVELLSDIAKGHGRPGARAAHR